MSLDLPNNIVFVHQNQSTISKLLQDFDFESHSKQNIIFFVGNHQDLTADFLNIISDVSMKHQQHNKSFVLVCSAFSPEDWPDHLVVAPSQQEALDIIDMEEMQRDLGF